MSKETTKHAGKIHYRDCAFIEVDWGVCNCPANLKMKNKETTSEIKKEYIDITELKTRERLDVLVKDKEFKYFDIDGEPSEELLAFIEKEKQLTEKRIKGEIITKLDIILTDPDDYLRGGIKDLQNKLLNGENK